jgi:2',3'-cyclic-nucleotide 2'-phosphodiesterase (5'-nucleotidase family)
VQNKWVADSQFVIRMTLIPGSFRWPSLEFIPLTTIPLTNGAVSNNRNRFVHQVTQAQLIVCALGTTHHLNQNTMTHLVKYLACVGALAATLQPGLASLVQSQSQPPLPEPVKFWLTLLHNNDGESQLINAGGALTNFGGVARFTTLAHQLKREALTGPMPAGLSPGAKRGVVMLSSGDNFLAGPEFNASLQKGFPYYDSIALSVIGYDAITIGNHEFDFGPDVLADFIFGVQPAVPFLSANLDVSGEPTLQFLEQQGRIAPSVILRERGELIGVVGATTPRLPFISSPRNVITDPDVAGAVQAEIDALTAGGVKIIIVSSHLQSIAEDLALAPLLRGVDIFIAGGGSELLANPWNPLVPGDAASAAYPLYATDADGLTVPVVTTSGDYKYLGKLVAGFDRHGRLIEVVENQSGPVRVAGLPETDGVMPNQLVQQQVVAPVQAAVADLAANLIATSEVPLDGRRIAVRGKESNLGNLCADSLRWQATQLAASFGVPVPDVALQNGGGIRNNSILPAGNLSELDTFNVVPFANFVCVVPTVSAAQFKEILENAVSRVEFGDGRFAQISGFALAYTTNAPGQVLDLAGNVVVPGARVLEVVLADGTPIVQGGVVVPGARDINIATIDFLARDGDQYPFRGVSFTTVGVTYQQALRNYLVNGLGGNVAATAYPPTGEGRITQVP